MKQIDLANQEFDPHKDRVYWCVGKEVRKSIEYQVDTRFHEQVYWSTREQIYNQAWEQIYEQVWKQVFGHTKDETY